MALDLGKQVGPLPLGAWLAAGGAGIGLALYTRRMGAAPTDPSLAPVDTGADPGVGTGPGWVAVPPPTTGPVAPDVSTNEAWGVAAINWLIAQGYDAAVSDSAIRKYLAGTKMSVQEYALYRIALTHFGSPPSPLPPGENPTTNPPPTSTPPVTGLKEKVKFARVGRVGIKVPIRKYIQDLSPGAGPNGVEQMLRNTVNDPRNILYRKTAGQGYWPGGAAVYIHYLAR